ncbi:MAG TPA: YebC/PmpR family DNA-binding transcriptional regulator, partial [Bacteroidetes bacterium]|nr:YebC/PmpR family DNA-binding transcriptional regulator [Bacteroidota bacterium]
GGETFTELTYEGYAPGGVAVFVECMTDNLNRTVSNVRHRFSKMGGNLATTGSVAFLFERKGIFILPKHETLDEEMLIFELIDEVAEDVDTEEGIITITTSMEDFGNMQKKLEGMGLETENASLQRIPKNYIDTDKDTASKVLKMIDYLEDDEDVQEVYHNMGITDSVIELMS